MLYSSENNYFFKCETFFSSWRTNFPLRIARYVSRYVLLGHIERKQLIRNWVIRRNSLWENMWEWVKRITAAAAIAIRGQKRGKIKIMSIAHISHSQSNTYTYHKSCVWYQNNAFHPTHSFFTFSIKILLKYKKLCIFCNIPHNVWSQFFLCKILISFANNLMTVYEC